MDEQAKYRVIGIAFILSVIAIIIPIAMVPGKSVSITPRRIVLPPEPERHRFHVKKKVKKPASSHAEKKIAAIPPHPVAHIDLQKAKRKPRKHLTMKTVHHKHKHRHKHKRKISRKARTHPAKPSWYVQVGLFSNKSNATHLQHKLVRRGFKTHIVRWKHHRHAYYKLIISPLKTKSQGVHIAKKINRSMHLDTFVVRKTT